MIKDNQWYDQTWNPITGVFVGNIPIVNYDKMCQRFTGDIRLNMSSNLCKYVYNDNAIKLEEPFPSTKEGHFLLTPFGKFPTYHKYRLNAITDKYITSRILLVCPMSDIFDFLMPDEWTNRVLQLCSENPQHIYVFNTRYLGTALIKAKEYDFPANWWFRNVFPTDVSEYKEYRVSHNSLQGLQGYISGYGYNPEEILKNVNLICHFNEITSDNINLLKSKTFDFGYGYKFATVSETPATQSMMQLFTDSLKDLNIDYYFFEDREEGKIHPFFNAEKSMTAKQKKLYYDRCVICYKEERKNKMHTIYHTVKRTDGYKKLGYVCEDCFDEFIKLFSK